MIYFGIESNDIQIRAYEKNFERENKGKQLEEHLISFIPTSTGTYKVGILANQTGTYAIDWSGQIN